MEQREYWQGNIIKLLSDNEVFVFGSNPEGIHGAGGAKAALSFGAQMGIGRGLKGNSYALVTKNLHAGFTEKSTGITYPKEGYCSVSEAQIKSNIDELYECAKQNIEKKFLITFQYETWPNGSPKKSLNGYTSEEMFQMFVRNDIPSNIVFHDSYKEKLEKVLVSNKSQAKDNSGDVIAFTKVSLPFGWMGNMAPYPVTHEGIEYKTTEALFQALRFTKHPEIQEEIRNQKSPMAAKMVAKQYKDLLINDGFEILGNKDVENMKLCVQLKLEQHPELAQQLIETGNRLIIEDCTSRPQGSGLFWGAAYQNNQWVGKNVLGEVLMEARAKLQNNLSEKTEISQVVEQPKQYTFFFHLTSPFSNFHPAKFEYKGYTFISNEQFMMFSKAKNFNDEVSAQKIIEINNDPLAKDFIEGTISRTQIVKDRELSAQWQNLMMKAKKLGRGVQNYDEEFWENRRYKIVLFGAREKFKQNLDLKEILMATGDSRMIESNPYDSLWGVGLDEATAKITPPEQWPGTNLLGKILDTLKYEFKNELLKKPKP